MIHSDEVIKLGCTDGKLIGFTLGADYRYTLYLDDINKQGFSYGSFDGSNEGISEFSFIVGSLG